MDLIKLIEKQNLSKKLAYANCTSEEIRDASNDALLDAICHRYPNDKLILELLTRIEKI